MQGTVRNWGKPLRSRIGGEMAFARATKRRPADAQTPRVRYVCTRAFVGSNLVAALAASLKPPGERERLPFVTAGHRHLNRRTRQKRLIWRDRNPFVISRKIGGERMV